MPHAEQPDRLRADYDQTAQLLRTITDVRFKLVAFVPTISGIAVGLLGQGRPAADLLSVGALGLLATLGVLTYELRNTQLYDYALARAKALESELGLGLYREQPAGELALFGVVTVERDRALALVYSAAVGGWTYLVAWGALRVVGTSHAQIVGGIVGAIAGIAVVAEFLRIGGRSTTPAVERAVALRGAASPGEAEFPSSSS